MLDDKDIAAGFLSISGGLLRILVDADPDVPLWKQFCALFVGALPMGWLSYFFISQVGYEVAAFPAGFFVGLIALSLGTRIAKDGAGFVWDSMKNIATLLINRLVQGKK